MRLFWLALTLACSGLAMRCEAGALDRVRRDGVLRCGSAIRPGLAFPTPDHSWSGLNVDICRAVAAAILPEPARIAFSGYVSPADFARIGAGADDLAFLTTTELSSHALFGAVLAGPTVFEESVAVMVADDSKVRRLADLGDTMMCVEPGTAAERGLHDYAALHAWTVNLSGWMELEEMMDAFDVGRCPAVVGEATALAALRLSGAAKGRPRILAEPLALAPVMAATPAAEPALSQVVGWTIHTLLWASRPETRVDDQTFSIPGAALGLDRDWQARAVAAAGSYGAMYRRSIGAGSPLALPLGPNAGWRDGGVMVPLAVQ